MFDFAHVIPGSPLFDDAILTKYGLQLLGSSLSYQLPPISINFLILSNLDNYPCLYQKAMEQECPKSLPVTTLDWNFDYYELRTICEHTSISKHVLL